MKKIFFNITIPSAYLVIAVIIGILARLWAPDIQSFWSDELFSWVYSSKNGRELLCWLAVDSHPPLYILFLHFWAKLFGNSETALRFPSEAAGILSIFATYFLSKKFLNNSASVSSTILVSLSAAAIYYSQEARSYSLLLLCITVLTLLWLELVKQIQNQDQNRKILVLYGLSAIITAHVHYLGTIYLLFQLIYLLFCSIYYKKNLLNLVELGFMIFIACLPWYFFHALFLFKNVKNEYDWIPGFSMGFMLELVRFFFSSPLLFAALLFPIVAHALKNKAVTVIKPDSQLIGLLYITFMPLISIFVISIFKHILVLRYFIIFLPPVYLLIALIFDKIQWFKRFSANKYIFIIALSGFIAFIFPNPLQNDFKTYYNLPNKQQWREATKYISENLTPETLVLVDKPLPIYDYYFNRYLKGNKPEIKRILTYKDFKGISLNKYDKIFVMNFAPQLKNVELELQKHSLENKEEHFYDLFFFVYEIKRPPGNFKICKTEDIAKVKNGIKL